MDGEEKGVTCQARNFIVTSFWKGSDFWSVGDWAAEPVAGGVVSAAYFIILDQQGTDAVQFSFEDFF